jgi:hypothetical protein
MRRESRCSCPEINRKDAAELADLLESVLPLIAEWEDEQTPDSTAERLAYLERVRLGQENPAIATWRKHFKR